MIFGRLLADPGHGLNKLEHVGFVQGFRKTIISKPRTNIQVHRFRWKPLNIPNHPEQSLPNNPRHVQYCSTFLLKIN